MHSGECYIDEGEGAIAGHRERNPDGIDEGCSEWGPESSILCSDLQPFPPGGAIGWSTAPGVQGVPPRSHVQGQDLSSARRLVPEISKQSGSNSSLDR